MKILIAPKDGIGDLILSLPLASAIKKQRPQWKVYFLVNKKQFTLTEGHPAVDGEILRKPGLSIYERARFLRQFGFDVVIDLYPSPENALAFSLSGIPRRLGTIYRWFSFLYTDRVKVRKHTSRKHESEYNLDFIHPLGIEPIMEKPRLYLREEEKIWAHEILKELPAPRIAINPSSGGTSRNWPFERYRMLAEYLLGMGFGVVMTGSQGPSVDLPGILDLRGKTTLRELMALLNGVSLLVSSSTGPMHMACALDTPTVSLFYPEGPSGPKRWGPLHPNSVVLTSRPGDKNLESISIGSVLEAVERIVRSSG